MRTETAREQYRREVVLLLVVVRDLSYQDAALALGVPIGTVERTAAPVAQPIGVAASPEIACEAIVGHARQAGGDSTLKLRRHGYGGLGAKSSAAVHCKGARSTAGRILLRPEYRYQALRLKAHRCAAAGLDSGTAAERLASMPSTKP